MLGSSYLEYWERGRRVPLSRAVTATVRPAIEKSAYAHTPETSFDPTQSRGWPY